MPPFYRNLIQIWRKHGGNRIPRQPRTKEEAMGEQLWGNNMIVDRHHQPLYYPSLARSGFITVGDLLTKPQPASNTVSSTIYYIVKSAIPAHWWNLPHGQEVRTPTRFIANSLDPLPLSDSSTRGVYLRIREACLQTPVCRERFAAHNVRLSDQQWRQLWDIPVHISFSPFSRDCIWKLLRYMLSTTAILYQCQLSTSDLCPACNIGRDTIKIMPFDAA